MALTGLSLPGRAALAIVLVLVFGCGGRVGGPRETLTGYSEALRRGDYGSAYTMMSASFRDQHSKDDFIRMMKENPDEVRETTARLKNTPGTLDVTAEIEYGLGERLRLVREGDRWRIATNPILFYSQATPGEALRSFVRAYRLKRWGIMLRFVPNRYRELMDESKLRRQFDGENREDVADMMRVLEANLDEPITAKGNEARMPYGERYEVKFVREDGLWKILDID